ncbi:MAG: hypothetical protein KatS3mg057_2277 [Herpetosiphonaceae bacterium]|nr:MAG: hypothetical protein KatS3mg057_2277 [Herpetosiphonaceae bacterium]
MLIGMNVDLADAMVTTLNTQSDAVGDDLVRLIGVVDSLLGTWQGGSRQTFENQWMPLVKQVNDLISSMHQMGERLHKTADAFRQADVF